MNSLKLAVIGTGHLGRIHARLLSEVPDVDLVAVVDPVASAREQVAADCRTRALADHRELLGVVDGAVIATPTRFHHAVALDFLRHGTPLLVEKPLATTVAECDELVTCAQEHGTILQVGHIERFNPAFTAATSRVNEPKYIEGVRAAGFTGRSMDIGVVSDLMIHDIDLVLSLVDAPLVRVDAMSMALLTRNEDVCQARLEFANGCVANLSASRVSPSSAPSRKMQIWSGSGYASIDFGTRSASFVTPCEAVSRGEFDYNALPAEEKAGLKERMFSDILKLEPLEIESRNALADEQRDFIDSIRNATSPRVTGRDGRDAVAVAAAVLRSAAGQPWVQSQQPAPILRGPHWRTTTPTPPLRREAG